jgi:two-component system chemotaxis response regulator CheB
VSDGDRIRVLVVDDSAFARKVIREVLATSASIEVVGIARDGLEALQQIAELKPDVVTLDLVMPNLDGVATLHALSELDQPTKVVVVSFSDEESELVVDALQAGAIDFVRKPTALATGRLYGMGQQLVETVLAAAKAKPGAPPAPSLPIAFETRALTHVDLVVIGTSTGGPQALTQLLPAFPADFPVPLLIALHIPVEYTAPLAERLDRASRITVREAGDAIVLRPGLALLARGGMHLRVDRAAAQLVAKTTPKPASTPYMPSVDVLFESAAAACGARVLGVVLTGMGDDGLLGSRAIRAARGQVLTEAEASCVIYGMPRSVDEAGLSSAQVPLGSMVAEIVRRI